MLIKVVTYDSNWVNKFKEEKEKIEKILGDDLLSCYHIGSTSVNGLDAKPIIDIMPVVKDISKVDLKTDKFKEIGYECLGENGIEGRRFFRKGGGNRTHHIHIFEESRKEEINRHLAVRDYLRTHPYICGEYAELKKRLAKEYPNDIDGYCDGKDFFVKQMEKDALKWSNKRNKY